MLTNDDILERASAFGLANSLVTSVVERYGGLEATKSVTMVFNVHPLTPVDQHIDHTLRVADWLLDRP